MTIAVERAPSAERLEQLGVHGWPAWTKEASVFPWTYGCAETCYVLEGEVVVTPDGGAAVEIRAGDMAAFPAGLSCAWDVRRPIRKQYNFG